MSGKLYMKLAILFIKLVLKKIKDDFALSTLCRGNSFQSDFYRKLIFFPPGANYMIGPNTAGFKTITKNSK